MSAADGKTCKTCVYWEMRDPQLSRFLPPNIDTFPPGKEEGFCHRYPPNLPNSNETWSSYWCGELQASE